MSETTARLLTIERYLSSTSDQGRQVTRSALEELSSSASARVAVHHEVWHALKSALRLYTRGGLADDAIQYVLELALDYEQSAPRSRKADVSKIMKRLGSGDRQRAEELAQKVWQNVSEVQSIPAPSLDLHTILICDNEQAIIDHVTKFLQNWKSPLDHRAYRIVAVDPEDPYKTAIERLAADFSIRGVVIDWDLGTGEQYSGAQLSKWIKQHYSDKQIVLLTGRPMGNVVIDAVPARCFSKADPSGLDEMAVSLWHGINQSLKAPFFDALSDYSERSISVFHALATSRGRAIKASPTLAKFRRFYGDRIFSVETSSTMEPLDSLLDPSGTLREAQELAAQAFGADRTFFVTGGTSAANKIVHQALLRPGDKILIDQNCHKSHHYALVLAGAQPIYLHARPVIVRDFDSGADRPTDIFSGISIREILDGIEKYPDAKMLCLTNCTFDGIIHDPIRIIDAVVDRLSNLRGRIAGQGSQARVTDPSTFIFFFDEAWFSFARCTSSLRDCTAMWAAAKRPTARIYATQSTHKTMIAFRQGSMVHARDPKWSSIEGMFKEAVYAHSTTSPNANMLASLDVGRVWALTDGPRLCEDAISTAQILRSATYSLNGTAVDHIRPLDQSELLDGTRDPDSITQFRLDPTKITFVIPDKMQMTGPELRLILHEEYDIQLNKTTDNTILAMTNAGSTASTAMHLVHAIQQINERTAIQRESNPVRDGRFGREIVDMDFIEDPPSIRDYFFENFPRGWVRQSISLGELLKVLTIGTPVASARFVIPYPPGFPVLVPGQLVYIDHVLFLKSLANKEVHGMMRQGILEVVVKHEK